MCWMGPQSSSAVNLGNIRAKRNNLLPSLGQLIRNVGPSSFPLILSVIGAGPLAQLETLAQHGGLPRFAPELDCGPIRHMQRQPVRDEQ